MSEPSEISEHEALLLRVATLERATRRQRFLWLGAGLLLSLAVGLPAHAELHAFEAGTPARASDINANFLELANMALDAQAIGEQANTAVAGSVAQNTQLRGFLEAKVGAVGQPLSLAGTQVTRFEVTGEVGASVYAGIGQGVWGLDDTRDLIPADAGLCVLTQNTSVETTLPEHDTVNPRDPITHRCSVVQEGGMWKVRASLSRSWHQYSEVSTTCAARCLRWR